AALAVDGRLECGEALGDVGDRGLRRRVVDLARRGRDEEQELLRRGRLLAGIRVRVAVDQVGLARLVAGTLVARDGVDRARAAGREGGAETQRGSQDTGEHTR